MAKNIIDLFPEHHMYVEGFGGAGHVLFRKEQSPMEVYNDIHRGLYLIFKLLREGNDEFIRKISLTPYSREEFEDSKSWMYEENEIEKARKFYVRTMQSVASNGGWCYAKSKSRRGMCQSVSRWLGNVDENMVNAIERLRSVQIENLDVIDLIKKYDKEDTLFYLDPPYIADTRGQKKSYMYELTNEEHELLVETLLSINGKVVLSGYDHHIYNRLEENGWRKVPLGSYSKRSQISKSTQNKATECVWLNY